MTTEQVTQDNQNNHLDITQLLETLVAVKKGDFTVRMPIDQTGLGGKICDTFNEIIEMNERMVEEFKRISTVVGKEGKIAQRASLGAARGSWTTCVDSVNTLITDLVQPMAETAHVIRAVANGDLSQTIALEIEGRPLKGEFLQTAQIVNTMVEQLGSFASEVTRVAREVGTEGKLGVQAEVKGVAGTWKDLTDNVNLMAGNLTAQVRNIAEVTTAVANGDLSKKITVDVKGEILELKNTINIMVDQLNSFASEVTRVAREVGTEGKLGVQAEVKGVAGTWKDLTDNVNLMAGNLTGQVRNIAEVTKAVANGDLSKKITVDVKGEILELKNTINIMVDQLNSFASEVTRVAREVGTEGKLGGQAEVKGVAGTWKDLTDSVNSMAGNLTAQVRNIARVVTAVANGDLKRKLALEAKGEIATLADTINEMIDTLATFADQVTSVAREVGIEGKLGGQAKVPGAAGTWRDLTDNVNAMAANLTTQVRAIAEVATAVTKGDLTRSISVETQGEVAILKDNINQMIANLRETTQKNTEQDWLKTNLAKFTRMLQGQRDLETVSKLILSELTPLVSAQHGVFYLMDTAGVGQPILKLVSTYAYRERKHLANQFHMGEGLVGQCALEKERILLTEVPYDYIKISSGLGEATPLNVVVLPVLFEGQVTAVIELASFRRFSEIHLTFFDQLTESIAIVLNTIAASMRTEELLKQSQSLTEELQSQQKELTDTNKRLEQQAKSLQASEELLKNQQEELQQTNEELAEKARLLSQQNHEVERKNSEIEQARLALEEKAEQLALTSKYKSEFLANMSHELRTPLNSLLILARLLADNADANLSKRQVEFAQTIHAAGTDLLSLINDILDLAKIESGTMVVDIDQVVFADLGDYMDRTFRQVAQDKGIGFIIQTSEFLPRAIHTDSKRLQQVLKNLLSNAFKFTDKGQVTLHVGLATEGWSMDHEALNRAECVVAFSVSDTGIGIPGDKQRVIFEAFQQADGTTSRKYGGTGLGLSISREIARLLHGEIRLVSQLGVGSKFTLYLPQTYVPTPVKVQSNAEGVAKTYASTLRTLEATVVGTGSTTAANSVGVSPQVVPQSSISNTHVVNASQSPPSQNVAVTREVDMAPLPQIVDDRGDIQPGDRKFLIVEDDTNFARILLDMARQRGFKAIVALRGDEGLNLAQEYMPDAIALDINLPVIDGWTILERLKENPKTRHIPIHIVSVEECQQRSLQQGAIAYMRKPVSSETLSQAFANLATQNALNGKDGSSATDTRSTPKLKHLLLVEDDVLQRQTIVEGLGNSDLKTTVADTGSAALRELKTKTFDCVVLDLKLPDISGFQLIEQIRQELKLWSVPIIVYTGRELSYSEDAQLKRMADMVITKDDRSLDRLVDETCVFLNRVRKNLPVATSAAPVANVGQEVRQPLPTPPTQNYAPSIESTTPDAQTQREASRVSLDVTASALVGRKVLIVDDDARNVFALASMLERYQMEVVYADNGRDGISMLQNTPDIAVVLMDVMMPEMDGYETMQAIRQIEEFKTLPMIALTAKAMKGDREKCIEAGASDYITKPVDTEQLLTLLHRYLIS